MNRKETRKYYFSVEGQTEKWYLQWLEKQLNNQEDALYSVKFNIKISKNPNKMVKQITVLGDMEIVHIYDFEEIQNEQSFKNTLSNMKSAAKMKKKVKYKLGYTNFTFDLWIILHKECLRGRKNHRSNYLIDLNRCFNTYFESMLEYKEEDSFKKLLNSLTLDNVVNAIRNAEKIEQQNLRDYQQIQHCGYEYFRENPSLSIHKHIKDILETLQLWNLK